MFMFGAGVTLGVCVIILLYPILYSSYSSDLLPSLLSLPYSSSFPSSNPPLLYSPLPHPILPHPNPLQSSSDLFLFTSSFPSQSSSHSKYTCRYLHILTYTLPVQYSVFSMWLCSCGELTWIVLRFSSRCIF